jgi:hypothetical protein
MLVAAFARIVRRLWLGEDTGMAMLIGLDMRLARRSSNMMQTQA